VKNAIHYVGLDVHKETIAVALCDQEGRATSLGTIPNGPDPVARLMRRLQQKATLRACYEAGCCGYVLQRQLTAMGIDCIVVAPSLIPVKSGDRVKTDRRDALKLARYLRAGELTAVWVPDETHEALRDLVRLREDAKAMKRDEEQAGGTVAVPGPARRRAQRSVGSPTPQDSPGAGGRETSGPGKQRFQLPILTIDFPQRAYVGAAAGKNPAIDFPFLAPFLPRSREHHRRRRSRPACRPARHPQARRPGSAHIHAARCAGPRTQRRA